MADQLEDAAGGGRRPVAGWRADALLWIGVAASLLWAAAAFRVEDERWGSLHAHYLPIQVSLCHSEDQKSGYKRNCTAVAAERLSWISQEKVWFTWGTALAALFAGSATTAFTVFLVRKTIGPRKRPIGRV